MKERNILTVITKIIIVTIGLCFALALTAILVMWFDKDTYASEVRYLTEEEMKNRPVIKTETSVAVVVERVEEEEPDCTEIVEEKTYKYYEDIPLSQVYQEWMQECCDKFHVGFAFALAIMESESSFDVYTKPGDGNKSLGAMQINKPNWYRYGFDAHFPADNIYIGVRMLSELIEKYQECDMVVMAYKGGESFAEEWVAQGKRLEACDVIVDRTMYWQEVIDKE